MKSFLSAACALVLTASLAACETRTASGGATAAGTEVARFHLGQPVARSQISIEPFDRADANRPDFPAFRNAVSRQLARLGWTVVATGMTEQVALIDVEQGSREAIARLSPARIGAGAPASPPATTGSSAGIVATLLEVSIKRRSDGSVFWEGRAVTEARAGTPQAAAGAVVEKLAEALFRDFPGESGRTIRLR